MNRKSSVQIIFFYKKTGKYALNVLAGALSDCEKTRHLQIQFVKEREDLVSAIHSSKEQHEMVLVCWSFYSPQFEKISRELTHVRNKVDAINVIHLAGGVHATAEPLQTLRAGFNYVAVGEGESIIIDFVSCLLHGGNLNRVKGVATLDEDKMIRNGSGNTIDLNRYPAASARYRKFGPIEITRGCIYACRFCQTPHVNKAKFRHRSIEKISEAVRVMVEHSIRDYRFISPSALSYGSPDQRVNLGAVDCLLSSVRNIIGPERQLFFGSFPSEIRPEHISKASLAVLKRYVNNDHIIIGGQSGSLRVLELARRGHDVDVIEHAVRLCNKLGFQANVDFLYGLPGETEEDVQLTLALCQRLIDLGAKIHNHTFMPLPGTPFRNRAPGKISHQVKQQFRKLSSQGKVYGQWQKQIDIAQQLADLNSES